MISALLKDGSFLVRGVTRNASSQNARSLEGRGATVVQADLGDEQALREAVADAFAVFAVTAFA